MAIAVARVLLEREPIAIATTSVSIQSQVLPEEVSEAGVGTLSWPVSFVGTFKCSLFTIHSLVRFI